MKTVPVIPLSDAERELFLELLPPDHYLRRLAETVDFQRFRPLLEDCYADFGRPPLDAVLLLKLEVLARHYGLADRELLRQTRVNAAFRLFLNFGKANALPHDTSLTHFRQRVGAQRLQAVFHELLALARGLGLVRDRLRLKDATHLLADLAVPSTLRLLAQTRERLLAALQPLAPTQVAEEAQRAEALHLADDDLPDAERLRRRVSHLRAILAWADTLPQPSPFRQADDACQARLRAALALAHKVLADRSEANAPDQLRSLHDPDARRGKHGDYDDGYLLDVAMDADSELITGLHVLPANADEAADAAALVAEEEQAHGNDVQALSLDGIGYRGDVLRGLTEPGGLQVEVFVPPRQRLPLPVYAPEDFTLSADGRTLTCPAGQVTAQWERNSHGTGRKFRFAKKQCGGCALRGQCLAKAESKSRTVIKNDYEAEYRAAQAKAQTPAYAEVRKRHPAVERKLAELVRRHGLRRPRYRGRLRVWWQGLMTALVVNLKRLVRLREGAARCPRGSAGAGGPGTVRAGLAGVG
jgi:hypothetical protein